MHLLWTTLHRKRVRIRTPWAPRRSRSSRSSMAAEPRTVISSCCGECVNTGSQKLGHAIEVISCSDESNILALQCHMLLMGNTFCLIMIWSWCQWVGFLLCVILLFQCRLQWIMGLYLIIKTFSLSLHKANLENPELNYCVIVRWSIRYEGICMREDTNETSEVSTPPKRKLSAKAPFW